MPKPPAPASAFVWVKCRVCGRRKRYLRSILQGRPPFRYCIRHRPQNFRGVEYLVTIPAFIPKGWVLVHNHVRPGRLGSRGFRAWLQKPKARHIERCMCRWATKLTEHYRVV